MKPRPSCTLLLIALALPITPALASTVLFAVNGTVTPAGSGPVPAHATATFTISDATNELIVTLANTAGVGELGNIGSVLGGLQFTLQASLSNLILNSTSPSGTVDCTSNPCAFDTAAPFPGLPEPLYGWGLTDLGLGEYRIAGQWHPDGQGTDVNFRPGIVNNNIRRLDGISNAEHNPYLLGPVEFRMTYDGADPGSVESAAFFFGTGGDHLADNSIPEPAVLPLVGAGLLVIAQYTRKKGARR